MKAAIDNGNFLVFFLFLAGIVPVFIGILGHAIPIFWGEYKGVIKKQKTHFTEYLIVGFILITLFVLGLWIPNPLNNIITQSANIINNVK
jgi:hypothetical protein